MNNLYISFVPPYIIQRAVQMILFISYSNGKQSYREGLPNSPSPNQCWSKEGLGAMYPSEDGSPVKKVGVSRFHMFIYFWDPSKGVVGNRLVN